VTFLLKGVFGMKQLVLVSVALAVAILTASAGICAPYDFEFTADTYANEDTLWGPQEFYLVIENTGTNLDTIDLLVTVDAPTGWSGMLCIDGRCVGAAGEVILAPTGTENLSVLVFNRGMPEMGLGIITGTMRTGGVVKDEVFAAFISVPSILLVDDDAGATYETYMDAALDSAGYDAHVWDADARGRPGAARLASYRELLWTTADGDASYLTSSDEDDIMAFLDGGGNLCLASMGFLSSRGGPTTFTTDYLHLSSWTDDVGASTMIGIPGTPIGDGMTLDLTGGPFTAGGTDGFPPGGFPAESFFAIGAGDTAGLGVDENGHRLVFLSFPFEAVPVAGADPDNQKTLMARIMDWFDPPVAGITGRSPDDNRAILRQNSPNPFTGSTNIAFSVPGTAAGTSLEIYDVEGRLVRSLAAGYSAADEASVVWDGNDTAGHRVAAGVYFYRLSGGQGVVKKMVLLE
jgi:hypothetical protein